ncbi:MAG: tRNA lysidine(34) synthetase TilS [Actinomycetota bacterium]
MTAGDREVDRLVADLLSRCTFPEPAAPSSGRPAEAIAGVSGGADSLALLVLATAAGLPVTAVHVDHGLRPGSAAEADVVAVAAERFGAGFRSERVVVEPGSDLEQRARDARLAVLGVTAMTGHTADDQAETVLLNLMRGAGPPGLAAMAPGPRHPILGLRRSETEALCRAVGLDPVADPSNRDPRFRRNRVRNELLPLIGDIADRDPVPLLARTAALARAVRDHVDGEAADLDPTDTATLAQAPLPVAQAALRRWLADERGHPPSAAELDRVMAVVDHEVVACQISGGRRIARSRGRLRIEAT